MSNHKKSNKPAVEQLLDALFYRADCPTSNQLLDYHLDLVTSDEQSQLQQHVSLCTHCSQELIELRAVELLPNTIPTPATRVTTPQPTLLDSIHEWLRQLVPNKPIITSLVESGSMMPAMALRGSSDTASTAKVPQQHVYNADTYRLSLRVTSGIVAQADAQIHGHIMNQQNPEENYIGTVHLIHEQSKLQETPLDEFGFFNLDKVPANQYTLLLELAEHSIWIQNLTVS